MNFEEIYKTYPRKIGKKEGMQKCKNKIKTEEKYNQLKVAVENYAKYVKSTNTQYIKHFSTFMNNWEDWIELDIQAAPTSALGEQLRGLFNAFRITNEDTYNLYLDAIKSKGFEESIAINAIQRSRETLKTMPSLAHLLEEIRLEVQTTDKVDMDRFKQDIARGAEDRRLGDLIPEFKKRFPGKNLQEYVKYWFVGVYGLSAYKSIGGHGLSLNTFNKSALFDLEESNWNAKEAIEIGKNKI